VQSLVLYKGLTNAGAAEGPLPVVCRCGGGGK